MTEEMPNKYSSQDVEKKWTLKWEETGTYVFKTSNENEAYVIDTPPPTVSGDMHAGHAFSYAQQDFIARYQRMKGKNVFYPFGTDDNGLPTERLIERLKKVKSKKMERSEFVKLCDETIKEIQPAFIQDWKNLGMSCDFSKTYSTIDDYSRKTSQASFIDLYKKGRVYQEESPVVWCVQCQTAIAQAEFERIEKDSLFNDIIFSSKGKDLIVATTRPEFIPACVALCFHPDDARYQDLKGAFASVPLFDYEVPIITDESVDPEKGTGLLMVCTFGDKEDVEKWHKHKLELRVICNKNGVLNELAGAYEGMRFVEARKKILEDLKEKKKILNQKAIKHFVNVHDKCGTEIEFLKTKQWYIKVLDKKHELLKAGEDIKWYPDHMKKRYVHWVENLNWDWCISRQRHFGIPFPVWYEKDTGNIILAEPEDLPIDPMQNTPKSYGGDPSNLIPETDVMDTWATSSVSPEIILDWQGESGYGLSFDKYHPCSLRPQGHDIIRTWAFYTIVKSLFHHNAIPWNEILITGHALDAKGHKLAKSKGNYVPPRDIMEKYGADSLRLWAGGSKLGENLNYKEEDIRTEQKTVTKLWNAHRFVLMHLKDYQYKDLKDLELMDQWLLIKLNDLIKKSSDSFETYEYSKAKQETDQFFWTTFCDYYLEIVKDRLYNPDTRGKEAQESGQYALYKALLTVLKCLAPFAPYVTEELYSYYFKGQEQKDSIHLNSWPEEDPSWDNKTIEETGNRFIELLAAVRKKKSEAGKSLKTGVKMTLTKEDFSLLEPCIDDFKAASQAEDIKAGDALSIEIL